MYTVLSWSRTQTLGQTLIWTDTESERNGHKDLYTSKQPSGGKGDRQQTAPLGPEQH